MKKIFFSLIIISALILGACENNFIGSDKDDNKKDNNQSTKKNKDEQQDTKQNNNQISGNEAIKRVKTVFKTPTYHDFKIDTNRSNNSEYFITFLLNDAVGTPQSSATTVNKQTGEVGDYIDDRTEEEKENYIKFIRESPKYKGSTEKLEEQARKDHTRPNDNERKSNEQKPNQENNEQSNEEQPRNEGGTAKITPPETNEEESDEQEDKSEEETQQEQEIKNPEPKKQKLEEPKEPKTQEEPETQERREQE